MKPFWKAASVLLSFKPQLLLACAATLISAASLGAGLGMTRSVFQLLLKEKRSTGELIQDQIAQFGFPEAGRVVVKIVPADPFWAFVSVIGFIFFLAVLGSVARFGHELATASAVLKATARWRERIFKRLVRAPILSITQIGKSSLISRIISDCAVLSSGFTAILGKGLGDLCQAAAAVTVAALVDWRITLTALVSAPGMMLLVRRFGSSIRRHSHRVLHEHARLLHSADEALRGLQVVKLQQAEAWEKERFGTVNRDLLREEHSLNRLKSLSSPLVEIVTIFFVSLSFCAAAWQIFRQGVDPSSFMTALLALAVAGQSIKPLTKLANKIEETGAAAERLLDLMRLPVEEDAHTSAAPFIQRHKKSIQFHQVGFTYPGHHRAALRDISFEVSFGSFVALVGANGAGKSTLVSLLPRIFDVGSGRILVDGIDIRDVGLSTLRRLIAFVPQDPVLFQGSVAENIAYGSSKIDLQAIESAARMAQAHEFISHLPQGYQTQLGELGWGISGGQKQRIAIARAILRNPSILILDEATNQIDTESEEQIQKALQFLRGRCTVFAIAHRLSTVVNADFILVLSQGEIADIGSHAELIRRCAIYSELVRIQLSPGSRNYSELTGSGGFALKQYELKNRVLPRVIRPELS
ncbi:MAG: ABC transporter ATP-binding protein [Acidobacteria bacterium]|nr:ABC transporter ATP-binding protein [Acidobacteriota bacterium]